MAVTQERLSTLKEEWSSHARESKIDRFLQNGVVALSMLLPFMLLTSTPYDSHRKADQLELRQRAFDKMAAAVETKGYEGNEMMHDALCLLHYYYNYDDATVRMDQTKHAEMLAEFGLTEEDYLDLRKRNYIHALREAVNNYKDYDYSDWEKARDWEPRYVRGNFQSLRGDLASVGLGDVFTASYHDDNFLAGCGKLIGVDEATVEKVIMTIQDFIGRSWMESCKPADAAPVVA